MARGYQEGRAGRGISTRFDLPTRLLLQSARGVEPSWLGTWIWELGHTLSGNVGDGRRRRRGCWV